MSITAIVGAQWGDEGKGKMTDALAAQTDFVVRFQGGANAGHTIINEYGKFALHLLPSGVFYSHITNVLGHGVALNIQRLAQELTELEERGVPRPKLKISDRAQIVMPYHLLLDRYEEDRLAGQQFGSTQQGIAPFYADKYQKVGIQVADLFDKQRLVTKIENALVVKNLLFEQLYGQPMVDVTQVAEALATDAKRIEPYVDDTFTLLQQALAEGKQILLEGQLGALRDPDHGIYPYSTSSSTLAGFGAVGSGLPPHQIKRIIAVAKTYSTCVGAGPFVTELWGDAGEELRRRGGDTGEYGATTGRARRVGWFDGVATRYGCQLQGATEVALTNLDVLGYLDEIPICTGYEIDGCVTQSFPTTAKLEQAQPVLEILPGWGCELSTARSWSALPDEAKEYVNRIEGIIGIPVRQISIGPKREALITR